MRKELVGDGPTYIKKHTYPLFIYIYGAVLLFCFLCIVPHFLVSELPYHYSFNQKIALADTLFDQQNYQESINLYMQILARYPDYKKGKITCAKAFFVLSEDDESYYWSGMSLLAQGEYYTKETEELCSFLPEMYKEDFKSHFVKA